MSGSLLPGGCNPADVLYKLAHGRGLQAPVFEQVSDFGPPHCKTFTWSCSFFEGQYKSVGNGRSKKEAKNAAAKNLISQLDLSKLPEKPQRPQHPQKRKFTETFANSAQPPLVPYELGDQEHDLGNNSPGVLENVPKKKRKGFGSVHNFIGPGNMMGGYPGRMFFPPRRTFEDNQVMEKHMSIYPDETELYNILQSVDRVELALKNISDNLAEVASDDTEVREVTGVARVGDLAKTLMLRGDSEVDLVVMCSNKPTKQLLNKIVKMLKSELETNQVKKENESNEENEQKVENETDDSEITSEENIINYHFEVSEGDSMGGIHVKCLSCSIRIFLTSTMLRNNSSDNGGSGDAKNDNQENIDNVHEEGDDSMLVKVEKQDVVKDEVKEEDPDMLLSAEDGLKALAEVRRAKWFTAMALPLPSCVEAIRIMKDKARRDPAWKAIGDWALELLVERALFSVGFALSPSKSILRIMEAVAAGLLLPGGPGIKDPCEREVIDVFDHLTLQAREDITRQAQIDLRNILYKKIHVVLGSQRIRRPHEMKSAMITFKKEGEDDDGTAGVKQDAVETEVEVKKEGLSEVTKE